MEKLCVLDVRDGIAFVTFDSGGMNKLSSAAVAELTAMVAEIDGIHAKTPLKGVILKGNRFGLGAGADLAELGSASEEQMAAFVDRGHELLYAIEDGPLPWLAVVDGFALGGMYELALACRGIIATERSTVGLPEIQLNIFPGLGGTQRLPRRIGLVNAKNPIGGDAALTAVLTGKLFKAPKACEIGMVDAVMCFTTDIDAAGEQFLLHDLPLTPRKPSSSLAMAEMFRAPTLSMIRKATMGRPNPRAPYVALDVMLKGAALPLKDAIKMERDAFLEVASSDEAKAGVRFFFAKQSVEKTPHMQKDLPKPAPLKNIGIAGIDGFMGNAIAWLCLEAGHRVTGFVPPAALKAMNRSLDEVADGARKKLAAKYAHALKKGAYTAEQVEAKVAAAPISAEIGDLAGCDLVIEALAENRGVKNAFFADLAKTGYQGIAASNSSSMGPDILSPAFTGFAAWSRRFINLHFFSPAEHPTRLLVEIVVGKGADPETVLASHAFCRSIGKTPVILVDGTAGFLVNAGLAAYLREAERLYREGTSITAIDEAVREAVFPMGPFQLSDYVGLDVAAGMFVEMQAAGERQEQPSLTVALRDAKRLGVKSGGGYYAYADGKPTDVWEGLDALVPDRGACVASKDEIVERCIRALYDRAMEIMAMGIVSSAEECDLAFVLGIGFPIHLGGPIFYGRRKGW